MSENIVTSNDQTAGHAVDPGQMDMMRTPKLWRDWLADRKLTQKQAGPLFDQGERTAQRWASEPDSIPKAVWLMMAAMVECNVNKPEDVLVWIRARKRRKSANR